MSEAANRRKLLRRVHECSGLPEQQLMRLLQRAARQQQQKPEGVSLSFHDCVGGSGKSVGISSQEAVEQQMGEGTQLSIRRVFGCGHALAGVLHNWLLDFHDSEVSGRLRADARAGVVASQKCDPAAAFRWVRAVLTSSLCRQRLPPGHSHSVVQSLRPEGVGNCSVYGDEIACQDGCWCCDWLRGNIRDKDFCEFRHKYKELLALLLHTLFVLNLLEDSELTDLHSSLFAGRALDTEHEDEDEDEDEDEGGGPTWLQQQLRRMRRRRVPAVTLRRMRQQLGRLTPTDWSDTQPADPEFAEWRGSAATGWLRMVGQQWRRSGLVRTATKTRGSRLCLRITVRRLVLVQRRRKSSAPPLPAEAADAAAADAAKDENDEADE